MIPYGRQDITEADIESVIAVLRSDLITQGPIIEVFEQAIATKVGARYGVAVNSATSALHLACIALGLGPGDYLWTSPITFVASANCGRFCGANVDFVDIDPDTYNLGIDALAEKLVHAERCNRLPKVIVAVHLAGQSCDMLGLDALRKRYGFKVIEDASHAIGGHYRDKPIGCGEYSDITIFSFHPVKIITTGEGGMLLTNQAPLAKRVKSLRSHGITRDPAEMSQAPDGPWYYQQLELGFNYRMTELQAALGNSQLCRLEENVETRAALAERYNQAFTGLPIKLPWQSPDCKSAWHLYIIRLMGRTKEQHRRIFEALRAASIGVNLHYIPVHLQPYYQALGFGMGDFPEAERYYCEAISLPLFPTLTDPQQSAVIDAVRDSLA